MERNEETVMTRDATDYTNYRYLSLEGVRGALAVLVCIGHLGLNTITAHVGLRVHFALSVDVFFALSGFVLCHSNYLGHRSFKQFAVGRFARLYPLHILTVILMALLVPSWNWPFIADILRQSALVNALGIPPLRHSANYPNWSISVEWAVSMLFFFLMRSRAYREAILATIIVALILIFRGFINDDLLNLFDWLNTGLLRGVVGFSAGALAYLAHERLRNRVKIHAVFVYGCVSALIPFFFIDTLDALTTLAFYFLVVCLLIILAGFKGDIFLNTRPMVFLGAISYSVYLLHIPILTAMTELFGEAIVRGAGKALVFATIIVVSYISFRLIERPAQRLILRRFGGNSFSRAHSDIGSRKLYAAFGRDRRC